MDTPSIISPTPTTNESTTATVSPLLQPAASLTIPSSQIYRVNESQFFGAGGSQPLTGVLIEWTIGCDLGNTFPIYPPTEQPWIAFMSSALLTANSTNNNSSISGSKVCDVSTLISIVQAISNDVTGVLMYQDQKAGVSISELLNQTEEAIQGNFFIQNPMIVSKPEPLTTGINDTLNKRELKGLSKDEIVERMKKNQERRIKSSLEKTTATKMSVVTNNTGSSLSSSKDIPLVSDTSNSTQPTISPLGIIALGNQSLIKVLQTSVNSKNGSVIVQVTFTNGAIDQSAVPIGQIPSHSPPREHERPRADRSLGLLFYIILGSVILILGVWICFGIIEARSLSRRQQQIALDNVKLKTVDQKVLDTYKIRIFQEDDILYSDDEDNDGNSSSAHNSRPGSVIGGDSEKKDTEDDDKKYQREYSEKEYFHEDLVNTTTQRTFARTDLSPLRRAAMSRKSGSFDETVYGGLDSPISRRFSGQDIFPRWRLSTGSDAILSRNDRCRSWAEGKAEHYEDYYGDDGNDYGYYQEKDYRFHTIERWSNLKVDCLQPLDGEKEKEVSEAGVESDIVSNLAIAPSLLRRGSAPSLRVTSEMTGILTARRGSTDLLNGSNLFAKSTLRRNDRFILPCKLEAPSLFIIPTGRVVSPTVYEDNSSSAGPSTAGFLPPPGWGENRRRSSHSTVAVPDNGRGIAQTNWNGLKGRTLRTSLQIRRFAQDQQMENDENESGINDDADDGRGVGQVDITDVKGKQPRISFAMDKSPIKTASTTREEDKSQKSPIEDYKARFSMIGVNLPDIYIQTEGEFSRLSLDADEIIMQSKGYISQSIGCQSQLDDKDRGKQAGELRHLNDQLDVEGSKQMIKSDIMEISIPVKCTVASKPAGRKERRQRKYDPCAICLEEYEVGEQLRELPCKHIFHTQCIDPWFKDIHSICPVCKRDYSPAAGSSTRTRANATEQPSRVLSFLTPLAVFAAGAPASAHYWYAAEASAYL
ncbi:E3 ubiquitin-protein ligase rnf13 [Haplosporangium sp. Z 27]|nr:E3 ubiquitin-protein ligase rnf13 [Haplosporangium sp. Z 27]